MAELGQALLAVVPPPGIPVDVPMHHSYPPQAGSGPPRRSEPARTLGAGWSSQAETLEIPSPAPRGFHTYKRVAIGLMGLTGGLGIVLAVLLMRPPGEDPEPASALATAIPHREDALVEATMPAVDHGIEGTSGGKGQSGV